MAHPQMFDPDDPVLARVRAIALRFPDAAEKVSHGRPAFFTKKVFAYYGGSVNVDGEWVEHAQSVMVLPGDDERPVLLADDRFFVPGYLGPSGWVGMDLDESSDFTEVSELIEESYRQTAGPRRVARLDAQSRNDRAR